MMTFKRVLYMILPENEQKLNVVLPEKINGHVYRMYASTDVMAVIIVERTVM